MERASDFIEKLKNWVFTALLTVVTLVVTKTFDKIDKMDEKIDNIGTTVQKLDVKQNYNDKIFEQYNERLRQLERDHTTVMLKVRAENHNN
jgi:hypothetical protein